MTMVYFVEILRPKGTTLEQAVAALREADPDLGEFEAMDEGEDERGAWAAGNLDVEVELRPGPWSLTAGPYSATSDIP